jgi:glycosyltransferase involved in cell wall biosynthesis
MTTRWAILTGEYPPQPGGVADYTAQVARGLADAGDDVVVFAPPHRHGKGIETPGVSVVRLRDHFGPRGLLDLDRSLTRARPDRVLIQYVPHAYGYKAMNLPFAAWVAARARRLGRVWVMFHEVAFPFRWRPPTHAALGVVTRVMARLVVGAAERVFVAAGAWAPLLRRLCPRARPAEWLPIPSNIPAGPGKGVSSRTGPGVVIGHFGTYGPATADLLAATLPRLLAGGADRSAVLLGRGGPRFRERLAARSPDLAGRLAAPGELPPGELAGRLRGCDVLLQPFIDGVSSRRGSVMAGLANGVPVVSNLGESSDPVWAGLGWESLAPAPDPARLAAAAEAVLAWTPDGRAELGRAGVALYRARFSLEHTVARLRDPNLGAGR